MTYLRLRWEDDPSGWLCHYELVIPLDKYDIRREVYKDGIQIKTQDELIIQMSNGPTRRWKMGESMPCIDSQGNYYYDRPYRDGVHASWDSARLGNLPIYVMAIDGTMIDKPEED